MQRLCGRQVQLVIPNEMRDLQALKLCTSLIQRPTRPHRYAEMSRQIMHALHDITPDIEIFSVDEAFLDVTRCQRLWGFPEKIGRMVQDKISKLSQLPCSVGVSGDKTTAKYAAELIKPNGFVVIPPWEAKQRLAKVPVTELCGIGPGIGAFLAKYGGHLQTHVADPKSMGHGKVIPVILWILRLFILIFLI